MYDRTIEVGGGSQVVLVLWMILRAEWMWGTPSQGTGAHRKWERSVCKQQKTGVCHTFVNPPFSPNIPIYKVHQKTTRIVSAKQNPTKGWRSNWVNTKTSCFIALMWQELRTLVTAVTTLEFDPKAGTDWVSCGNQFWSCLLLLRNRTRGIRSMSASVSSRCSVGAGGTCAARPKH